MKRKEFIELLGKDTHSPECSVWLETREVEHIADFLISHELLEKEPDLYYLRLDNTHVVNIDTETGHLIYSDCDESATFQTMFTESELDDNLILKNLKHTKSKVTNQELIDTHFKIYG